MAAGMMRLAFVCAVVAVLAAPAWCDPAWLAGVEKDIAAPGGGANAIKTLEALPLADRQTRDYHWALARACQADNKPVPAGDAVAVFGMLPPATPSRDTSAVEKWIRTKATEEYKAAVEAQKKGDRANGVKGYLRAIELDPAIQGKDDHGLSDLSQKMLANAVQKKPTEPALRFKHAVCSYLFGRLSDAASSFDTYCKIEKSPYQAWRGKLWLDKVNAELSAQRTQDQQQAAADKARKDKEDAAAAVAAKAEAALAAKAPASPSPGAETADAAAGGGGDRRAEIQAELKNLDVAMAAASAAAGTKYGKIAGQVLNVDQMRARRAALQNELNGLK